jgi:hypothetical protein
MAIAVTIGSVVIVSSFLATEAFAFTPPRLMPISVGINLGGSATRALENVTPAKQTATFTAMRTSGLTELRVDIPFDTTEPEPRKFNWHQTAYVRRAIADHLQVDGLLDYPPKWALLKTGSVSPKAFAAFAKAAAKHYAPLGVHLYELLNEPNRPAKGGARVDPVAYAPPKPPSSTSTGRTTLGTAHGASPRPPAGQNQQSLASDKCSAGPPTTKLRRASKGTADDPARRTRLAGGVVLHDVGNAVSIQANSEGGGGERALEESIASRRSPLSFHGRNPDAADRGRRAHQSDRVESAENPACKGVWRPVGVVGVILPA